MTANQLEDIYYCFFVDNNLHPILRKILFRSDNGQEKMAKIFTLLKKNKYFLR